MVAAFDSKNSGAWGLRRFQPVVRRSVQPSASLTKRIQPMAALGSNPWASNVRSPRASPAVSARAEQPNSRGRPVDPEVDSLRVGPATAGVVRAWSWSLTGWASARLNGLTWRQFSNRKRPARASPPSNSTRSRSRLKAVSSAACRHSASTSGA
jgi:hypothetical protein